jgi:hypothetical protein
MPACRARRPSLFESLRSIRTDSLTFLAMIGLEVFNILYDPGMGLVK